MRRRLIPTALIDITVAVLAAADTVAAQSDRRFAMSPPDVYYHDAVNWAVDNGTTTGCGDGTNFCPDRTLTRADVNARGERDHRVRGHAANLTLGVLQRAATPGFTMRQRVLSYTQRFIG